MERGGLAVTSHFAVTAVALMQRAPKIDRNVRSCDLITVDKPPPCVFLLMLDKIGESSSPNERSVPSTSRAQQVHER